MLIKIPKIYTDGTEEKTVDIWINIDLIIKIEPYLNEKQPSIAKSIVAMRDVEPWNWFKSTLTPDEIADLINYPKRGKTTNYTPYKNKRRPENDNL